MAVSNIGQALPCTTKAFIGMERRSPSAAATHRVVVLSD
jgi:hypothetical protein